MLGKAERMIAVKHAMPAMQDLPEARLASRFPMQLPREDAHS